MSKVRKSVVKIINSIFPFYNRSKASKIIKNKITNFRLTLDNNTIKLSNMEEIKIEYNKSIQRKNSLEDKAKMNTVALTISTTLFINLLKLGDKKENFLDVDKFRYFLIIVGLFYMILAGLVSINTIIENNIVYQLSHEDKLQNEFKVKKAYFECIELNNLWNLLRNNSISVSYICIRNSMILLMVTLLPLNSIILFIGFGILSVLLYLTFLLYRKLMFWKGKMNIKKLQEEIEKQKKIKRELIFLYNEAKASPPYVYPYYIKYFNENKIMETPINTNSDKIYDQIEELAVLTNMKFHIGDSGCISFYNMNSDVELSDLNYLLEFKLNIEKYKDIRYFDELKKFLLDNEISLSIDKEIHCVISIYKFRERYKELLYASITQKVLTEEEKNKFIFTIIKGILEYSIKLNMNEVDEKTTNLPFFTPFAGMKDNTEIRLKFEHFFEDSHKLSLELIDDRIEEIRLEIDKKQKQLERIYKFFIFISTMTVTAVTTVVVEKIFGK